MGGLRIRDWKLKQKVIFHIFIIGAISGSLLLFPIQNNVKGAIQAAQAAVYAWITGQ